MNTLSRQSGESRRGVAQILSDLRGDVGLLIVQSDGRVGTTAADFLKAPVLDKTTGASALRLIAACPTLREGSYCDRVPKCPVADIARLT